MDTNRHEFFNANGDKGAKVTSVGFNHEGPEEHEGESQGGKSPQAALATRSIAAGHALNFVYALPNHT